MDTSNERTASLALARRSGAVILCGLALALWLAACGAPLPPRLAPTPPPSFTGSWQSDFGLMQLEQTGTEVRGSYAYSEGSSIVGTVTGTRLLFRYQEPRASGEGWFELAADGNSFVGEWHEDGDEAWHDWNGRRMVGGVALMIESGFEGLFETNWGRLRLTRQGDDYLGVFATGSGVGSLSGREQDGRLRFDYVDAAGGGEGWFELAEAETQLRGQWRAQGSTEWHDWLGWRASPVQSRLWLVVLEPQWEQGLGAPEYSFGDMLRVYFEGRVPHVEVRHRRVRDREDLLAAMAETALLAEPVALWLSGHGTELGFGVDGTPLSGDELAAALVVAPNVFVLHFASCLVLAGELPQQIQRALGRPLPISGYTQAVDWGTSAAFEMLYLELMLNRGYTPSAAVEALHESLEFAGAHGSADGIFAPLGFALR